MWTFWDLGTIVCPLRNSWLACQTSTFYWRVYWRGQQQKSSHIKQRGSVPSVSLAWHIRVKHAMNVITKTSLSHQHNGTSLYAIPEIPEKLSFNCAAVASTDCWDQPLPKSAPQVGVIIIIGHVIYWFDCRMCHEQNCLTGTISWPWQELCSS